MSCFAVVTFSLFMYYVSSGAMINFQMSNVVECSMCELHVPGGMGNLTVVKKMIFIIMIMLLRNT